MSFVDDSKRWAITTVHPLVWMLVAPPWYAINPVFAADVRVGGSPALLDDEHRRRPKNNFKTSIHEQKVVAGEKQRGRRQTYRRCVLLLSVFRRNAHCAKRCVLHPKRVLQMRPTSNLEFTRRSKRSRSYKRRSMRLWQLYEGSKCIKYKKFHFRKVR